MRTILSEANNIAMPRAIAVHDGSECFVLLMNHHTVPRLLTPLES